MRTSEGVGGGIFGVGSKTRGGSGVTGDGIGLDTLGKAVNSGGGVNRFLRLGADSWNGLSAMSIVSSSGVNRRMAAFHALLQRGEPGDGGC